MLLELDEVRFAYGAVNIVDGVDLTIEQGCTHGLIGPNGAGKTTTIDLISGRLRPRSGAIRFGGKDITRTHERRRRRGGISRSFQRISVFAHLSVADQLDLAARAVGESDPTAIVEAMQLTDCLRQVCSEISYGQQRRVDIALALLGEPRLVLLDEPAAGLSRDESLALAELLRAFVRDRGMTVLLVEHDLEVVFGVCNRITVLDRGLVIADGEPESVRKHPEVVSAYLGRSG